MTFTHDETTHTYTLETETRRIDLTGNEVSYIVNQFMKMGLRQSIDYLCHEMDGDTIDLRKAPDGNVDDFIEEVYLDLEDDVDYGDYPSEDYIKEKIQDTANYYDMEYDGDDYDEDEED